MHAADRWTRAARFALLLWAVGFVLHERLAQAGAYLTMLLAPFVLRRTWGQLDADVRRLCVAGGALVGWQMASPFLAALAQGTFHFDAGRFSQSFEPLGTLALPIVGALGVPIAQMALVLVVGWIASAALAVYHHFFAWPFENPKFLKIPSARVRENFATDGDPRYGGGGFFFHRLRLAHGGLALLGPALAMAARKVSSAKERLLAGALIVALFTGITVAYARAALGVALVVTAASTLLLFRGKLRLGAIAAGILLTAAVLSLPGWRERAARSGENLLQGERRLAMTAGLLIFQEHPVVGVGYANHRFHAVELAPSLDMALHLVHDSHNVWITTLAEGGVPAAVLLLVFHVLLARALWRRHVEGDWIASGALLSFASFHLLGLVHYLPFHSSVALSFYFVFGLALVPRAARSALPG